MSFSKLEERKENVTPRAMGWDVELLTNTSGIEELGDDISDPIASKIDKIRRLRAANCSKTVPKQLAPQYTELIYAYNSWDMYKNDLRFVRLCLEYAEMVDNPLEMFTYMEANGIGSACAVLYEQWSNFLEGMNKSQEAIEVLNQGIHKAQPSSYLKTLRNDIIQRGSIRSIPQRTVHPQVVNQQIFKGLKCTKRKLQVFTEPEPEDCKTKNPCLPQLVAQRKENQPQPLTFKKPMLHAPNLGHTEVIFQTGDTEVISRQT